MKKDPRVYLAHILECIDKIQRYTKEGKANFLKDTLVQDAVIRNFEVMAGFRDVLIHNYEGVDVKRVWQIVEQDLQQVKTAISALLPPLEQLERELAGESDPPNIRKNRK